MTQTTKQIIEDYRNFLVENELEDLNKAEVALCINILEYAKEKNDAR